MTEIEELVEELSILRIRIDNAERKLRDLKRKEE